MPAVRQNLIVETMEAPRHDSNSDSQRTLMSYLIENSDNFAKLEKLKKKDWKNPAAYTHWQKRNMQANPATQDAVQQAFLYKMTQQIVSEMHMKTEALTPGKLGASKLQVLDICMAPGGFTWGALKYNPNAISYGITLPEQRGGYKNRFRLRSQNVRFMDVTMLASECGIDVIPDSHPDFARFLQERPFLDLSFQLIFCGGAVLRSTRDFNTDYPNPYERTRLTTSQLVLAMQRIMPGGTMVVLLGKPEHPDTTAILRHFDRFARIELFKSRRKHTLRSTFYLVARDVQSESHAAKAALEDWKARWYRATFGGEIGTGELEPDMDTASMASMIDEFGTRLIELASPVWEIQAAALLRQDFNVTH
ncbi:hypothetical protein EJ05DRAFT_526995 [Pseudovirgaria hyperparasitica]|uniref:Ribosomal RNA methyltransferase FtsJ domain-containing protein n=1 Tax=Pseudovirgaria hyperparasitica TaxID=470096 RepID=A0A6A6WBC8_9PEZI|nr:uncharacterized protein EJ05DRAFT_526995 [Pseudovirgaria hyperparasitica]KAF2758907.1 hypothetical protein EJ05DRAFT_526995 [Pseudovirgaria hyperparasitica]